MNSKLDFIYTDGHAVDRFSAQYTIKDIQDIDNILDINAIKSKYWNDESDLDKKRRKEAEFLVLGDISNQTILGFVVYNNNVKDKLINYGVDVNKIHVSPNYFFKV